MMVSKLLKRGGLPLRKKLTEIIRCEMCMKNKKKILDDWNTVIICPI